ncbi:hypothetical protein EDC04DRAFT_2672083 [Pisolithus marmoratus]|nr:hypothetical protein EDC04DRAFT_2672083 [Pisolithus marmoratus]
MSRCQRSCCCLKLWVSSTNAFAVQDCRDNTDTLFGSAVSYYRTGRKLTHNSTLSTRTISLRTSRRRHRLNTG